MVIITGTGRSGTSLLMLILHRCGVYTALSEDDYDRGINAGMELPLKEIDKRFVEVVKSPEYSDALDALVRMVQIDHIIVPMRNLHHVVTSRAENDRLVGVTEADQQRSYLLERHYAMCRQIAALNIPFTLIDFNRMTTDCDYLYSKISPVFPKISAARFRTAYYSLLDKSLIHYS